LGAVGPAAQSATRARTDVTRPPMARRSGAGHRRPSNRRSPDVSSTTNTTQRADEDVQVAKIDLKLEVVVIPVADADRSKAFYAGLGWRLDADFSFDSGFRVVQFTPPRSPCSVQFGTKMTDAPPGSAHGLYLIVSDIDAGRDQLLSRGAKVGAVFHSGEPGAQLDPEGESGRVSGPDPDHKSYSSFATFEDPDGNSWLLQEVTDRLPGR